MATVPPRPNKKQKIAADTAKLQAEEENRIPEGLGNVRVQFLDETTGNATGAPVTLPLAQASVKNLELLLNSLLQNVRMLFASMSMIATDGKTGRK